MLQKVNIIFNLVTLLVCKLFVCLIFVWCTMNLFTYHQPKAEYVQFQRLIFGLLVLFAVLFENINLIYAFLVFSTINFIVTINNSPITLVFRLLSFIYTKPIFVTPPQYAPSYIVSRVAEFFEDMMRILGALIIIYFYYTSEITPWIIASSISIAMLISTFFGFCLSSIFYIWYKNIKNKFK